jgi:hypothetical protein
MRFTIRDVLWLTVVVAIACALWIQLSAANRLRDERTLWKIRAMQLEASLKSQTGAVVEFLPDRTNISYGPKATEAP